MAEAGFYLRLFQSRRYRDRLGIMRAGCIMDVFTPSFGPRLSGCSRQLIQRLVQQTTVGLNGSRSHDSHERLVPELSQSSHGVFELEKLLQKRQLPIDWLENQDGISTRVSRPDNRRRHVRPFPIVQLQISLH